MIRIGALLCLLATAATAQDRVSILAGSHHFGASVEFQESNPGLFLTWDRVTVGAYVNSYDRQSVALTYALPVMSGDDWSVDLFGGAAWYSGNGRGFAVHVGDIVPIGGVQARYRNVFVQLLPSDGKATDAIIAFGLTFDLHPQ